MENSIEPELKPELKKVLGSFDVVMMGIGCIIGVGIYILSGFASANYAGPAVIISFIIAAFVCTIVGFCYGELACIFPLSGSAYSYAYNLFGRKTAWYLGWVLLLEYIICSATVASGWSAYFQKFLQTSFKYSFPDIISVSYGSLSDGRPSINLIGLIIIFFVTYISILGIKESAKINNIMVCLKIAVLLFFVGFCLPHVNTANWFPFVPERIFTAKQNILNSSFNLLESNFIDLFAQVKNFILNINISKISNIASVGHYGLEGILAATAVVFFTYVGFDMVASIAEETKNPKRNIPIGIIGSLSVTTVVYIAVTLVLIGIIPPVTPDGLPNPLLVGKDVAAPLSVAISSVSKSQLPPAVLSLGALAGVTTTMLTLNLALSRILLSISRDKFLPEVLSKIHPKFQTPHIATIAVNILISLITLFLPLSKLAELASLGGLVIFIFVCFAVLKLRKTQVFDTNNNTKQEKTFQCPFSPALPILSILFCLILGLSLSLITWLYLSVWLLTGTLIYFLYGRSRSKEFLSKNNKIKIT